MASLLEMLQKISDYSKQFFKYSRLNNLDVVSTSFCRTPLHIAVMSDDIKFAKNVLSLKPDLALTIDSEGFTPLHLASAGTNLQMVRLLLAARPGACIVQDEDGRTPLHLAAMKDRVEIMKLLMEDGLPEAIHLKKDEETILHLCVKSNCNFETLELLVDKLVQLAHTPYPNSISIYSKDSDDKTILQLAAEMGKIETLQYLLNSSNIKFEVNDVKQTLQLLSATEKNDLKIGFRGYSRHGKMHRNKTVSKANGQDSQKERVNTLMVVATLIAGIAFQATLNPPGGYWQDDTKVDSGTDPVTFIYYLNHMFASEMSANWESYLDQKNVKDFIQALMKFSSPSSVTSKGLVFEDFNLTRFVSDYKNSNGNGGFMPHLIRYAGYPILAYRNPLVYTIYMNTNIVAFLVSLIIILLVLSGTVDDYQLRTLVVLMCISTLCIGTSYVSILFTISPKYYNTEPTIFSLYGFFGLYCLYGIIVIVQIVISRMDKLRSKHLTGIKYFGAFVSMNASTAGKLMLLSFGYGVIILLIFASSGPQENRPQNGMFMS